MASGHVNRTNRPNTWLHRPACGREESPCQLGAVHTWHFSVPGNVRLESVKRAKCAADMSCEDSERAGHVSGRPPTSHAGAY